MKLGIGSQIAISEILQTTEDNIEESNATLLLSELLRQLAMDCGLTEERADKYSTAFYGIFSSLEESKP